jgi:hypothetical protein
MLPNRMSRRTLEAVLALGSLALVLLVVGLFALNRGDGEVVADDIGDPAAPITASPSDSNNADGQGPTALADPGDTNLGDDGTDGDNAEATTTTTTVDQATTTVVDGNTTTTTTEAGPSTTVEPATTIGPSSTVETTTTTIDEITTTTEATTTTTEATTTTTEATTTTVEETTTTTALAGTLAIEIVSGPTLNVRLPTSFQFSYDTNEACGTGSFRVLVAETRELVGEFEGEEGCFGPGHGGFPGATGVFSSFDIKPDEEYLVLGTVRGTEAPALSIRPTGTGNDSYRLRVPAFNEP